MELKQRLLEGVLVGVVGGLVATAIGGIGVLIYSEMKESKELLAKTTKVTKQLNESSNTGIDRLKIVHSSISSIIERINKLEEESKILSEVSVANDMAIGLISDALKKADFTDKSGASAKIKEADTVTSKSSKSLERLPEITSNRDELRLQQQQQQFELESYQQQQQIQQQQQLQEKW